MTHVDMIHDALSRHFLAIATFSGVPLLGATLVGLVVAFVQAVTQIQDQTMPQLVKVLTISLILLAFGNTLAQPLIMATDGVLSDFWMVGR